MSWPWATKELTDITCFAEEEKAVVAAATPNNEDRQREGLRPLPLLAPGGGSGELRRPGAYRVVAHLEVEGKFQQQAIAKILWLTVSFRNHDGSEDDNPARFPKWILKLKNLRGLSLEGYPHETLPDEIGHLVNLERFHAYRSSLVRLPRSMGQLQNLIELDCYTSYKLHYLPYEITRCPKLKSSRFSTRALYNNYKYKNPVPPLQPWWDAPDDTTDAATIDSIHQTLASVQSNNTQVFPPEFIREQIDPCLQDDICSVCNNKYQMGSEFHVWSHQVVATDKQSLLAFCCSKECASKVPHQIYFDPVSKTNLELEETKSGRPKSFSVEAALKAYAERNERIIDQDINDWYRDWAWEHLGIEWNQSE